MSKLLINEKPLVLLPSLAVAIGINQALVVQQLHYWLNTATGVTTDGCKWIYNTMDEWLVQFPFFSKSTLERTVSWLVKNSVLIVKKLAKSKSDRTNFYTIDYKKLDEIATTIPSICGEQPVILTESKIPSLCGDGYTENTTETTTDIFSGDATEVNMNAKEILANRVKAVKQVKPIPTPKEIELLWKQLYADTTDSFCVGFTMAQLGMASKAIKRTMKEEKSLLPDLIQLVIPKWSSFTAKVRLAEDKAKSPDTPNFEYLVKYLQVAIDWLLEPKAPEVKPPQKSPTVDDNVPSATLPLDTPQQSSVAPIYGASMMGKDGSFIMKGHVPQESVPLHLQNPCATYTEEGYQILEVTENYTLHAGMTILEMLGALT